MFDIITIGDTITDVFLDIDEGTTLCKKDMKDCQICFPFGSKIPVKHIFTMNGGGNASNVAVGTSRLGLKTAIYTIVGDDDRGTSIRERLKKEKVAKDYVVVDKKQGTNYAAIINYTGDRTVFAFHEERMYRLPRFAKTPWIYFSSICGNYDAFHADLAAYVTKKKIKLAFNPGSKQMRLGLERLRPVIAAAEILFVNKEEAEVLVGRAKHTANLISRLKDIGANIVVITDGERGSTAGDGAHIYELSVLDVPVVQRTGCGDAYASGFTSARTLGLEIPEAMRWGSMNASGVIQNLGSQGGLLTRPAMKKLLAQHPRFQAKPLVA